MTLQAGRAGFIGLGRMGRGMALNLLKATGGIHVHDAAPDAVSALTGAGAVGVDTPGRLAAACDIVFLCLPSAVQVRQVLEGGQGLLANARRGLTVVDTSTLDRSEAVEFGRLAGQAGVDYWDCPVSGMPFRADAGTLTVMFGGTEAAFAMVKPYLRSFGEDIIHCGGRGSGQAMKAVNNIIYDINIAALCEVLPLAVAVGLDPVAVGRLVTSASSRSFASDYFVPRMLDRKFDTDFTLDDAHKDIVNIQTMAAETGVALPTVNGMIASYRAAQAAGFGGEPKSAMLKVYEQAFDVTFARTRPE